MRLLNLVADWRRVVSVSLSFWMGIAGLLVLILPELRFYLTGQDYDPVVAWWLGVLFLLAGLIGRLWQQGDSRWREWARIGGVVVVMVALAILAAFLTAGRARAAPPSEAETLQIAVPFIAAQEGERTEAYLDIVGVPTICYGSTRGVRMGMRMTHAECLALLRVEVAEYRSGLWRYYTVETRARRLTPKRDTAYTSLAFNCGIGAIGKSTAVKRLNAGDIPGGCEAIGWWNKAGKRVMRGLVRRRGEEQAFCMAGV